MKETKYLGIEFINVPENNLPKIPESFIVNDWEKYLGKVVKGRSSESYFVITGLDAHGFRARFLNPYFEQTGRPAELTIPFSHLSQTIEDPCVEQRFKENLKKIRNEIPDYNNPKK
jgi:hypothetical protein